MRSKIFCIAVIGMLYGLRANAQCNAAFADTLVSIYTRQFIHPRGGTERYTARYQWTFGDGQSDSTRNPMHTFTDTGTFRVCLSITIGSVPCTSDSCIFIHIDSCQAYFTYIYEPALLQPEQDSYVFTDSSTGEEPGTTWLWSYGNGDFSSQQNPGFNYEADDRGPELVCLTIRNPGNSCTSQYCRTIQVDSLCIAATYSYTLQGTTAVFRDSICGTWNTLNWSFDDGTDTSQVENVAHTFPEGRDSFFVCLTVNCTALCGYGYSCKAIYCQQIQINPTGINNIRGPLSGVTVSPNPAEDKLVVSSDDLSNPSMLEIIDVTGRQIFSVLFETRTLHLNISHLPSGLYFVIATEIDGQKFTSRFVKQ